VKKVGKPVFLIVVLLIAVMGWLTVCGVSTRYGDIKTTKIKSIEDIRWGIDIRGGVDVTFAPADGVEATDEEMKEAENLISLRLVNLNITDSELYTDYAKNRIILRFPWKADETDFNAEAAVQELGSMANLTFREGFEYDEYGRPAGTTLENIVLTGADVQSAEAVYTQGQNGTTQNMISLTFKDSGKEKFSEATGRLIGQQISIWMDDTLLSAPVVQEQITDGKAQITGTFTAEQAVALAEKINAGALPFALVTESFSTISPTLGLGAKNAMVLAGAIAFAIVAVIMVVFYRVPGFVAVIALAGQVILLIASLTGFFTLFPAFTLTLPGIAGIILAIGFGVDANIITAERIKEEFANGRSLDAAIDTGFKNAFSAIIDGNVTVIIVAIVLLGAFGPTDSLFARLLSPLFRVFGQSAAGMIYSFGYTLLVGVILNLVMGVFASRLMLKSVSRWSFLRNPALYGGGKQA